MSVISVRETWRGRGSDWNAEGQRTYTRTFRVITDTTAAQDNEIRGALSLTLLSPYPEDLGAFATNIRIQNAGEHPCHYDVEIPYSTRPRQTCNTEQTESPLDEPPLIVWRFQHFSEAVDRATRIEEDGGFFPEGPFGGGEPDPGEVGGAVADAPIINTSGEPYDPPITRDAAFLTCTIERNVAEFDVLKAMEYTLSVNEDQFTIDNITIAAERARLYEWTAIPQYKGSCAERYFRETYQIQLQTGGWDMRLLDQGFCTAEVNAAETEFVSTPIRDQFGNPLGRPVLLNGEGQRLTPDDDPIFMRYRIYPLKNFTALGLP